MFYCFTPLMTYYLLLTIFQRKDFKIITIKLQPTRHTHPSSLQSLFCLHHFSIEVCIRRILCYILTSLLAYFTLATTQCCSGCIIILVQILLFQIFLNRLSFFSQSHKNILKGNYFIFPSTLYPNPASFIHYSIGITFQLKIFY